MCVGTWEQKKKKNCLPNELRCRSLANGARQKAYCYHISIISVVLVPSNAHCSNKPSTALPTLPFTAPHSQVPTGLNGGGRNNSRRRRSHWRFCVPTPTSRRRSFFRSCLRLRGHPPRLPEAAPSGSGPRFFLHLPFSSSEAAVPLRCCGRSLLRSRWVSASLSSKSSQRAVPCISASNNSLGPCRFAFVEAYRSRVLDLDHLAFFS